MIKEEDEFIRQHWHCLKKYQDKGEKPDGILRLGDCDVFPHKPESEKILMHFVHDRYLETLAPLLDTEIHFKFTGCGKRYAKRITFEFY